MAIHECIPAQIVVGVVNEQADIDSAFAFPLSPGATSGNTGETGQPT
jgi:hypothetical protein